MDFGHIAIRLGKEASAVLVWGPATKEELEDMAYGLGEYFREENPNSHFYRTGPGTAEQITIINLSDR